MMWHSGGDDDGWVGRAEGVLRGGDVLARAVDAADDGQRAAPADRQQGSCAPGPRAQGGARRGISPSFFSLLKILKKHFFFVRKENHFYHLLIGVLGSAAKCDT